MPLRGIFIDLSSKASIGWIQQLGTCTKIKFQPSVRLASTPLSHRWLSGVEAIPLGTLIYCCSLSAAKKITLYLLWGRIRLSVSIGSRSLTDGVIIIASARSVLHRARLPITKESIHCRKPKDCCTTHDC